MRARAFVPKGWQLAIVLIGLVGISGTAASKEATKLTAIEFESGRSGFLVHLVADGSVSGETVFALKEPVRLVLDLPALRSELRSNEIAVDDSFVGRIRVGVHPEKLRIVIDSGADTTVFRIYKTASSYDGMFVLVGRDRGLELILESRLRDQPSVSKVTKPEPARAVPVVAAASLVDIEASSGAAESGEALVRAVPDQGSGLTENESPEKRRRPGFQRPGSVIAGAGEGDFARPGGRARAEGTDTGLKRERRGVVGADLERPDYALVGVPDRWRIVEGIGVNEKWWDPYHQNTLKGDRPILGTDDWFLEISAISDTLVEPRKIPVPAGAGVTQRPILDAFGQGGQLVFNQNWIVSAAIFKGDTTFRPPDWEFRFTGVANINYVKSNEFGLINANPLNGDDRFDYQLSIIDAFVDKHLWNKSDRYDFDSIRVGIQPFISDFRGFLFDDANLGVRFFGNAFNNRIQYNLAYFRRIEKDINSGLPEILDLRDDDVFLVNAYYEDFPVLGFTLQGSVVYNRNRENTVEIDVNGFRQRPAPIGSAISKEYDVVYLGLSGDGHIDRLNLTFSMYYATGKEMPGTLMAFPTDSTISAWFTASEFSMDFDWYRIKAFGMFGSGDDDPNDSRSTAFDAIFDNPNFAGSETSYWARQSVPLIFGGGVGLSGRNSFLNSLRTSKEKGQSNFVNPGIGLVGLGADFDVLPELRVLMNASWLTFIDTEPLELLRQQADIDKPIGFDLSAGIIYRPLFIENLVLQASAALLLPGDGFRDLYPDDEVYYSTVFNIILTY